MSNNENLTARELLYRAYAEIHRKEQEKEKERQKVQPDVLPFKEKKVKTPLDYLREGYRDKKDSD